MTVRFDAVLSRKKQSFGNVRRVGSANGLPLRVNGGCEGPRVGRRFCKNGLEQVDDILPWRLVIIEENDPAIARITRNVSHR